MKKLNITKKQYDESKYFQSKYGKLEYVSESGKLYKTSKGKVLKFNESYDIGLECACDAAWYKAKQTDKKMYDFMNAHEAEFEDHIAQSLDDCEVLGGEDYSMFQDAGWIAAKELYNYMVNEQPVAESYDDIENDPAYTCPYCDGHDCEFDDANDVPDEGYFDGSTLRANFYCLDCGKPYSVNFKLTFDGYEKMA